MNIQKVTDAISPETYDNVMECLYAFHQAGFHTAIVAGGFWRDTLHSITPRDVDLFIWDPFLADEPTNQHILYDTNPNSLLPEQTIAKILGVDVAEVALVGRTRVQQSNETNQEYDLGITCVWAVKKCGLDLQVIATTSPPADHVKYNFDVGLCKVYHDGDMLHITSEFMLDALNKTLTVYADEMSLGQYSYTRNVHLPRFQDKYPNHKVVLTESAKDLEFAYQMKHVDCQRRIEYEMKENMRAHRNQW